MLPTLYLIFSCLIEIILIIGMAGRYGLDKLECKQKNQVKERHSHESSLRQSDQAHASSFRDLRCSPGKRVMLQSV
jgi:hypothetical protein